MKKRVRKKSITEPKFGRIFLERFIIMAVVFSLFAVYGFTLLGNYVKDREHGEASSYNQKILDTVMELSETDPASEEYRELMEELKMFIALYESLDRTYIEVRIGGETLTADDYFAFFCEKPDTPKSTANTYHIEDTAYLAPLYEYLENTTGKDLKELGEDYYKYEYEYLHYSLGLMPFDYGYNFNTVYVNNEDRTFIPGVVMITDYSAYKNEITEEDLSYVDCTPSDTKGYEYQEWSDYCGFSYWMTMIGARLDTELSSEDICEYCIPDEDGNPYYLFPEEYDDYLARGEIQDKAWLIGYSEYIDRTVFELAPISSSLIIIGALLASLLTALILATVRYYDEKAVWKIFEYRTKTTEAMAHDLKTPLAAIMGYAENMEEYADDPSKVREYSKNINEKVNAMDHMIGDILSFSRSETGKIDIVKEELSVAELVKESLEAFPGLKTEISGDLKLTTDRKLLKQAIDNLLSNCERYGDKDGVVDIRTDPENLLIINKTDKTYDDVNSLKKPFVKGEDSRGGKGSGLGLAIAENNLNILGYKLELVSEEGTFKAIVKFK